jgi:hypothetical protein
MSVLGPIQIRWRNRAGSIELSLIYVYHYFATGFATQHMFSLFAVHISMCDQCSGKRTSAALRLVDEGLFGAGN